MRNPRRAGPLETFVLLFSLFAAGAMLFLPIHSYWWIVAGAGVLAVVATPHLRRAVASYDMEVPPDSAECVPVTAPQLTPGRYFIRRVREGGVAMFSEGDERIAFCRLSATSLQVLEHGTGERLYPRPRSRLLGVVTGDHGTVGRLHVIGHWLYPCRIYRVETAHAEIVVSWKRGGLSATRLEVEQSGSSLMTLRVGRRPWVQVHRPADWWLPFQLALNVGKAYAIAHDEGAIMRARE